MTLSKHIATTTTTERRYWQTETTGSTSANHSPRREEMKAAAFGYDFALVIGQNGGLLCVDPGRTALLI